MVLAQDHGFRSIAFPLIGAGSGGLAPEVAKAAMLDELQNIGAPLQVVVVRFKRR
jgi:O-acetyl-ADP-ribose deacetylase